MANQEGFAKIRNGIRAHIKQGKLTPQDLGVYVYLHLECDWATGIYHGTALGIAYGYDNPDLKDSIKRSLARLRENGYINFRKGDGRHKGYDVLINKFEPQFGKLSGKRLDAWKNGDKVIPAYEDAPGAAPERPRSSTGDRPDHIPERPPIPEVPDVSDVPEVTDVPSDDDRTGRFAETRETLDPKEQHQPPIRQIDEDEEELLSSPVHQPAPQAKTPIPHPPVAKIVRRDKGHRFAQTYNGLKCLACKTGFAQYERTRSSCPNEEMDIDAVDISKPEIPKEKPQVDMRNPVHTHDWSKDKKVCARCNTTVDEAKYEGIVCEAEGASA